MFALPEQGGDGPSTAKLNSLGNLVFLCVFWAGVYLYDNHSPSVVPWPFLLKSNSVEAQKATESPIISAEQSFPPGQGWDGASGTRAVPFHAHQYSTPALIGCSKTIYIFITGTAQN